MDFFVEILMFSTDRRGDTTIKANISELREIYLSDRRSHKDNKPWVMLNMIASSNGLATLDGLSGKLGGDEDRELFKTLRGMADFILVGLKTVLEERYNPPKLDNELAAFRESSGKDRLPRRSLQVTV